jgi:hypothetical protein
MKQVYRQEIEVATRASLEVLLFNSMGPFNGLPRTAGWGYPEPYTRDLMLSVFGIAVSGNRELLESIRKVFETLAENQTEHGHIPSLVHNGNDRGASDTTPLFILGAGIFRKVTGEPDFLSRAVEKAMNWMEYQSPSDRFLVAQQPTSDWRDEQWTTGYGLFVNTLVYSYLRIMGQDEKAKKMHEEMNLYTGNAEVTSNDGREGFVIPSKPYYAFWSYKIYSSERFDLLGNSLAILSGIASASRSDKIISWIESECIAMKKSGDLAGDLPPNFFPFIRREDIDWRHRYEKFNKPGEYHNGGIWPFVCGIYVAALVAAKRYGLAEEKLIELTRIIRTSNQRHPGFGFNEWIKAQDGKPMGEDWQTWSAALYLYAAKCVEERNTPFFDQIRAVT